jgi:hypothetical protein
MPEPLGFQRGNDEKDADRNGRGLREDEPEFAHGIE